MFGIGPFILRKKHSKAETTHDNQLRNKSSIKAKSESSWIQITKKQLTIQPNTQGDRNNRAFNSINTHDVNMEGER